MADAGVWRHTQAGWWASPSAGSQLPRSAREEGENLMVSVRLCRIPLEWPGGGASEGRRPATLQGGRHIAVPPRSMRVFRGTLYLFYVLSLLRRAVAPATRS